MHILLQIVFLIYLHTIGRKDALEVNKQRIEVLQDSISSVSTQLLPSPTYYGMCHIMYN